MEFSCPRASLVAPVADAAEPGRVGEFPLLEVAKEGGLRGALGSFFEAISREDPWAAPAPWDGERLLWERCELDAPGREQAQGRGDAEEAKALELPRMAKTTSFRGPRAPGDPAAPATGATGPASPFGVALAAAQPRRTLDDVAEDFLAHVADEDLSAPAMSWGEKVGYSIYDEEELLGPYVDMGEDDDAWLDELDGNDDDEDDEDAEGEGDSFWDDLLDFEDDSPAGADVYADNGEPSRLARSIRPLCCVDRIAQDLPERCPICLEGLEAGQTAWRLPCTHAFHDACMARFLGARRAKPSCPLCRCDVRRVAAAAPAVYV